jgi:hypothetical protein
MANGSVAEVLTYDDLVKGNAARDEVLELLKDGGVSVEDAGKYLGYLEGKNGKAKGSLYCKVSQKGAISVYGLQRMPVTLYVEQWERLLEGAGDDHFVLVFAREHDSELKRKDRTSG